MWAYLNSDWRRLGCAFGRHAWRFFGRERVCRYCHRAEHHMRTADTGEFVWFRALPDKRH